MPGQTQDNKPDQNGQQLVAHTSSVPCQVQKLPSDLLWYIGRNHIGKPAELLALATTSREIWDLLKLELYKTDIIYARDQVQRRWSIAVDDNTALVWAITHHHTKLAQEMIAIANEFWPEYVNVRKVGGLSAIEACALRGNMAVLKTLLASDGCELGGIARITSAIPDLFPTLNTPISLLHPSCRMACCTSGSECAYAINALGISVASGQAEVTKALLDHTDPQTWVVHSSHGLQATHVAVLINSASTLDMLLGAGHDASVGSSCFKGATAFHIASARADGESIRTIRVYRACMEEDQRIARIIKVDKDHRMAIHYAALHDKLREYLQASGGRMTEAQIESMMRKYRS